MRSFSFPFFFTMREFFAVMHFSALNINFISMQVSSKSFKFLTRNLSNDNNDTTRDHIGANFVVKK